MSWILNAVVALYHRLTGQANDVQNTANHTNSAQSAVAGAASNNDSASAALPPQVVCNYVSPVQQAAVQPPIVVHKPVSICKTIICQVRSVYVNRRRCRF